MSGTSQRARGHPKSARLTRSRDATQAQTDHNHVVAGYIFDERFPVKKDGSTSR
jgi:hypothetical protein